LKLERRSGPDGTDSIYHGNSPGALDDMAVAVVGAMVRAMRHEELFSPEFLGQLMFPKPRLTRKERFNKYVTNWLLDIPQEPWSPEDDLEE